MGVKRVRQYPYPGVIKSQNEVNDYLRSLARSLQEEAVQRIEDFNILSLSHVPWVDVRVHGAKGDGTHDDTAAIQAAINAINTQGGGTVVIPIGNYKLTDTLTLYSGVNVVGKGTKLTGSCSRLYQATAAKYIFNLLPASAHIYHVTLDNLTLASGASYTGIPATGKYGINCVGSGTTYGIHHIQFSRLVFNAFDRAINIHSDTEDLPMDYVKLDRCDFEFNNIGIYLNTSNAACWQLDTCVMIMPDEVAGDNIGLYVVRGGSWILTNCFGGGYTAVQNVWIKIKHQDGPILLNMSGAETLTNSIEVPTDATAQTVYSITSNNCHWSAPISLKKQCHYLSIGSRYAFDVNIEAEDILIDSICDYFLQTGGFNADWRIKANPTNVYFQNRIANDQAVGQSPGNILAGRREVRSTAAPTTGTWRQGDVCWQKAPTAENPAGWMCVTSGTFSAATDNTGDTDGSTAVITGMTDTSDFNIGDYVTVSAGFPTTGPYPIINKTATTVTLNTNSNSAESNITVSTPDPVWKAMANLAA